MDTVTMVFKGWLRLTPADKAVFAITVKNFEELEAKKQSEIQEEYRTKVQTGPMSGGCACCGR